jgi:hypothetical protein
VLPSRISSYLTSKKQTRLERIAKENYSSLFCLFIIDEEKKFHNIESRSPVVQLEASPVQAEPVAEQDTHLVSSYNCFLPC